MYTEQFQIESRNGDRSPELFPHHHTPMITDSTAVTRIESLLLGLRLRHWLTDSDRTLLDQLAPDHGLVFLIHHEQYLHPEGLPLFPLETIETGLCSDGDAFFTQRFRSRNGSNGHSYRIHTARIGELNDRTLILGLMAPERLAYPGDDEHGFMQIVRQFREADRSLQGVCSELAPLLASGEPILLINRSSGRIVTANQPMLTLLGRDLQRVADREFGALKNLLAERSKRRKLSMTALSRSCLNLCLLTLAKPVPSVKESPVSAPSVPTGFLTSMQNTVASIVACGKQLETLIGYCAGHPAHELLRIVLEESADLSRQVERFHLLAHAHRYPPVEVDLLSALRIAVDKVSARRPDCTLTLVSTMASLPPAYLPKAAPSFLFEALLNAHLSSSSASTRTTVTTDLCSNGEGLRVQCVTDSPDPRWRSAFDHDWITYATGLANALSVDMTSNSGTLGQTLETALVIPLTEVISHERIA